MKETKKNSWLCEVHAPPELHEYIETFFNALSYKLRHADGWAEGYKYGLNVGQSFIRCGDCKYFMKTYCSNPSGLVTAGETDYCSKARRGKTDENRKKLR